MEVLQGAGADVGPEGVAGRGPARGPGQLGHLGDEQRRQVVDDEEAEVFEDVGRFRPSRPGQPGDDRDVELVTHRPSRLTDRRAQ